MPPSIPDRAQEIRDQLTDLIDRSRDSITPYQAILISMALGSLDSCRYANYPAPVDYTKEDAFHNAHFWMKRLIADQRRNAEKAKTRK